MNRFHQIYTRVISNLEENLPSWLHYHSVEHTKHVLEKTIYIAEKEGIAGKDLFLLKVAALYHDIGFIRDRAKHEEISCRIARDELKNDGLLKEDIEKICNMIMVTRIPQKPATKLENILADADLEYLGTPHFKEISNRLYEELLHYEPSLDKQQWNEIQVEFMSNHNYHTDYCRQYREPMKLANLELIKNEVRRQG